VRRKILSLFQFQLNRIPEDSSPKSVVIDKETYHRLLKSCQVKTKERLEHEKGQKEDAADKLLVGKHHEI